ncbi:CaiB/BaiF CoA-transferase family protein [Conexibacter stalactiti]|uniref:CaiB/BaiF CoA-transferase family protein n=1 Tax=Conexibacter stalactiti TaxID=1940611 RepID=A0ABU4HI90_9ACTN|nr:CaiB/BaiF CoA-transferase family protein [Conexibacter stalactiti]MDW5593027.1 CaiB/BaiF CoA-transferase family protein [Conexibacter stalactiti]MEC5033668.1 CaiB/BaiF CoA-transferase family protein [Conexibacter stalactiti]
MSPDPACPLEGVRVLDFTRILSGPYCSLLLSDLGADVIKVERPRVGDDTRHWGPPYLDEEAAVSTYFAALNRGKRSIALDLTDDDDRATLDRLVERVDVVIENFRPEVAEQLGLAHERLAGINPAIVTCSVSGYGRTGPYAGLAGTEIVVEAMSGLMEVTGPADGEPVRMGIAMVDIATGLAAATRIVAALLHARESGVGAPVDVSLYATAIGALGTLVTSYSATGDQPRRWGSHHPTISPYGGFPCADGHLITGVINDARWSVFCSVIELPDLAEREQFATNALRVTHREELESAIAAQTRTRPVEHWVGRLRREGLLAAPIRTVGAAVDDAATRQMGLFVEIDGHPGVVSPRLDGVAHDGAPQTVPRLGEHQQTVLAELLPDVSAA